MYAEERRALSILQSQKITAVVPALEPRTRICLYLLAGPAHAADLLRVNAFAGAGNLALFASLAKGFFDKRDLKVELQFTPNSDLQRSGLAAGKFEIAIWAISRGR